MTKNDSYIDSKHLVLQGLNFEISKYWFLPTFATRRLHQRRCEIIEKSHLDDFGCTQTEEFSFWDGKFGHAKFYQV